MRTVRLRKAPAGFPSIFLLTLTGFAPCRRFEPCGGAEPGRDGFPPAWPAGKSVPSFFCIRTRAEAAEHRNELRFCLHFLR